MSSHLINKSSKEYVRSAVGHVLNHMEVTFYSDNRLVYTWYLSDKNAAIMLCTHL